jgi:chemosensory pili system protein ChpA (sensor histidine kinase/response regulator)
MHEAIDYNALGWVRNEVGETLNQARLQLEDYAADTANESLLQRCATQLHEVLGPLQMVGVKGAVLLTSEMEEVVADLLQGTIEQSETAMELLVQSFLQLPGYLSNIRSGREDRPQVLLPLINSLRATRGEQPLQQAAIFSPNLSARVPATIFDVRAEPVRQDVSSMARAARVRFQGGLLDWYRNVDGNTGLQTLIEVLDHLQQCAASEPVARIWWVGAGVAEALRDGCLDVSIETKQLFGQLDRQIKRLIVSGESVFDDVLSDDLMKNLLLRIAQATSKSERTGLIRDTYSIKQLPGDCDSADLVDDEQISCSDEVIKTVVDTIRGDIDRIREQLDACNMGAEHDAQLLLPVADDLHALANTLCMIEKGAESEVVSAQEQAVRDFVSDHEITDGFGFVLLANTLVSVEDALDNVAGGDAESAAFAQGLEAVTREVVTSMGLAKDAISEFIKSSDNFESLAVVPNLLNQIGGGLQLVSQERSAVAVGQVKQFITHELIDLHKKLDENQLDMLADAICSIEFYIEEMAENRSNTGTALDVAEQSMAKLGYPCAVVDSLAADIPDSDVQGQTVGEMNLADNLDANQEGVVQEENRRTAEYELVITELQVIAPDGDEEILEIFIEEADEEIQKLAALVPMWVTSPDTEYLADIRRSFHTLKGSGRMVGAIAIGELAWNLENLANKVIENSVEINAAIKSVLSGSVKAFTLLLAQVKGDAVAADINVNELARLAFKYCDPAAVVEEDSIEDGAGNSIEWSSGKAQEDQVPDGDSAPIKERMTERRSSMDLPVLSDDADAEIVEIFLEEAAEEIVTVKAAVTAWIKQSLNDDLLANLRRSLHTMKGSGRMAGAMIVGEFSWSMENLLNKILEGTVEESNAMRSFFSDVPDALSQLIEQVRGGDVPTIDVTIMMRQADALCRGEEFASLAAEEAIEDAVGTEGSVDPSPSDEADGEAPLMEIFSKECRDHLQAIEEFLEGSDEPRVVSDSLFRALHTLSGISESAEVSSIQGLTSDLNGYFDGFYQAQQLLCQDAINVLRLCAMEVSDAVLRLPDLSFDELRQQELRSQIAGLPGMDDQPAIDEPVDNVTEPEVEEADAVEAIDAPVAEDPDPFAEMDQELYEIFVEEASEIIDSSEIVLRAWVAQPDNSEHMTEFQRQLHTIKGGARMMDIPAIGDLSHVLESLMTRIADGVIDTTDELFSLVQESQDRLSEMLEKVKTRKMPAVAAELETRLNGLWQTESELPANDEQASNVVIITSSANADESDEERAVIHEVAQVDEIACGGENDDGLLNSENESVPCDTASENEKQAAVELSGREHLSLPKKVKRKKQARVNGEQVKVQSNLLDDMVNYAGEINIYRSRMEQQVSDYRFNLAELDQTTARLREQLRQLEMETEAQILFRYEQEVEASNQDFDPLEMDRYSNLQQLSRSLIESISDLHSLQELMENTTRESETLLLQQSRVSTDLQEGLMRTRMIPFSGLASRLRRIVRQSARQLGKKVDLELTGADGEMDRTVIERIIAPLEHMLRNAVAHGIELPEQRKAADKQENGSITITFDREGPEIILRIKDDGAGIDTVAIRARAIECGLMSEDSQLTDYDVMQFILQTGFSTAKEVTQISGRGVGLDVVNSEVKQLGGSLHIDSTAGLGTLFTVSLPYTLAINHALLVRTGEETFCVPLGSVEGVVRASCEELAACYRSEECNFDYAGNDYQLKHLGTLLNTSTNELDKSRRQMPVLLIRIGEKRIALHVDDLLGSREIVIKPVGAQLSAVDCISGATILGDGSVVMILDMAAVARMNTLTQLPEVPAAPGEESRLVVMVVDDSITVRKVTTRLLERNGYKVLTAKDGIDAMGQLQEVAPDMMLLDIEMPRMDGFELATHMRNDAALKHVPIIMITSRTGDKHRERAQQIGVNNYLGKPYQENDLLDSIQRIIGVSVDGAVA